VVEIKRIKKVQMMGLEIIKRMNSLIRKKNYDIDILIRLV
jgi:hypothetical protein